MEVGTTIQMHSQFKYALRQIIIKNSIEPSKTGNCTNFDDALCESEGILQFSWKQSQIITQQLDEDDDDNMIKAEQLLIQNYLDYPNLLRDNILYYVAGYFVKSLLLRIRCGSCKAELLLDSNDCHALTIPAYPICARFVAFKQRGGLIFPSLDVIKVVKATEVVFHRRVISQITGILAEKNLSLKIQNSVIEAIGGTVFANSSCYFDHTLGESDHLPSLVMVVSTLTCK